MSLMLNITVIIAVNIPKHLKISAQNAFICSEYLKTMSLMANPLQNLVLEGKSENLALYPEPSYMSRF